MNFSLHADSSRRAKIKITCIVVIIIVLNVITAALTGYYQKKSWKDKFQNEIRVMLIGIQIQIEEIIENDDRDAVKNLALSYERLGAYYASVSGKGKLFESYLDEGEWGTISQILLGRYLPSTLFRRYDGKLTEEERVFIKQLSVLNDKLLLKICDDSTFRKIKSISIEAFEEILTSYHLTTLKEFLVKMHIPLI